MAWWDEDITDLIRSLSTFAPYGSTITIVSPEEPKVPTKSYTSRTFAAFLTLP